MKRKVISFFILSLFFFVLLSVLFPFQTPDKTIFLSSELMVDLLDQFKGQKRANYLLHYCLDFLFLCSYGIFFLLFLSKKFKYLIFSTILFDLFENSVALLYMYSSWKYPSLVIVLNFLKWIGFSLCFILCLYQARLNFKRKQ